MTAFVQAQLVSLWCGPPAENACEVAEDILRFATHLDPTLQRGLCVALAWLPICSRCRTRRHFTQLSPVERTILLNQGEYVGGHWPYAGRRPPLINWDREYVNHSAIAGLAMLCRLVISSREPTRQLIGFCWPAACQKPERLITIRPPAYPDLNTVYDVCVIGSGAGGSVVAARAAQAGQRVLIVEAGKWVSPDALVQRRRAASGNMEIFPARGDRILAELYKQLTLNAGGERLL